MASLIGRWRAEAALPIREDSLPRRYELPLAEHVYEFTESGSYTIETSVMKDGQGLVAFDNGTYTVEGDHLEHSTP